MKVIGIILFGIIYSLIYFFLAVAATGGGHGNFYLFSPFATWLLIFIALFLLKRLESLVSRIFFIGLMLVHYVFTFLICLGMKEGITKDFNRASGMETFMFAGGVYLLGQLIIWVIFFNTIRNQKPLE